MTRNWIILVHSLQLSFDPTETRSGKCVYSWGQYSTTVQRCHLLPLNRYSIWHAKKEIMWFCSYRMYTILVIWLSAEILRPYDLNWIILNMFSLLNLHHRESFDFIAFRHLLMTIGTWCHDLNTVLNRCPTNTGDKIWNCIEFPWLVTMPTSSKTWGDEPPVWLFTPWYV